MFARLIYRQGRAERRGDVNTEQSEARTYCTQHLRAVIQQIKFLSELSASTPKESSCPLFKMVISWIKY